MVGEIVAQGKQVVDAMIRSTAAERATWLRSVGDAIDSRVDDLVAIADEETHLGEPRLRGEIARTTGQLRFFAEVILDGHYLEVIIDHADPSAAPPRPDLRRMLRPLGPVAVFAASNFPFAFSVAGGDTASALAAGCPVVVKAHPGHPETSRVTAAIVTSALADAGAPAGAFGLVEGFEAGIALASDPDIRAAAFTGSLRGGRAIHDICTTRPDPIPFFGELGSINPVVITPGADAERGRDLAAGLAGSFTLGVGQFCTKPGMVFAPEASETESALPGQLTHSPVPMLNPSIADACRVGLQRLTDGGRVQLLSGSWDHSGPVASPVVLAADVGSLMEHVDILTDEVFGPITILVRYSDIDEVIAALGEFTGSLTATIHAGSGEAIDDLVNAASRIAGRVLFEGWPTGVAVSWAQHHGGPWPATTSLHTSVGATSIRRFLRPIVYQDAPHQVLPLELQEDNPLGVPRRVDGVLSMRAPEPASPVGIRRNRRVQ